MVLSIVLSVPMMTSAQSDIVKFNVEMTGYSALTYNPGTSTSSVKDVADGIEFTINHKKDHLAVAGEADGTKYLPIINLKNADDENKYSINTAEAHSDANEEKAGKGNRVIVEVEYTVDACTDDAEWGVQFGIAAHHFGNTSKTKGFRKHTTADIGKTFKMAVVYTMGTAYNNAAADKFESRPCFVGAGDGTVTIKSASVSYVPAAKVADYSVITYKESAYKTSAEFLANGAIITKTLPSTGEKFAYWYESDENVPVTTATGDATLYPYFENDVVVDFNVEMTGYSALTYNPGTSTSSVKDVADGFEFTVKHDGDDLFVAEPSYTTAKYWPIINLKNADDENKYSINTAEAHNDGNEEKAGKGNKVIVEVEYTVDACGEDAKGLQFGVAAHHFGNNSKVKGFNMHTVDDIGKTFKMAVVYTMGQAYNNASADKFESRPCLVGTGDGKVTVKAINVSYIPAANVAEYSAVTYVESAGKSSAEFIRNGKSITKVLYSDEYSFDYWYEDDESVPYTEVSEDVVLTAKVSPMPVVKFNVEMTGYSALTYNPGTSTSSVKNVADGIEFTVKHDGDQLFVAEPSDTAAKYWPIINLKNADDENKYSINTAEEHNSSDAVKAGNGNKVIVEVEYTVDACADDATGLQFGVAAHHFGNNSRVKGFNMHTPNDIGKTFKMAVVYTMGTAYNNAAADKFESRPCLVGTGDGKVTIKSMNVCYLPAANTAEYSAVTFVQGRETSAKFYKNGSPIEPLADQTNNPFIGWYDTMDFSSKPVTSVKADTTLYARYTYSESLPIRLYYDGANYEVRTFEEGNLLPTPTADGWPIKDGCEFQGWYTNANYSGNPVTVASASLSAVYAKWKVVADVVVGIQTYEKYQVGSSSGVKGDDNGTAVSDEKNSTASGSKSLKLPIASGITRLTANTIIALESADTNIPFEVTKGTAYKVSFKVYAENDLSNVVWSVNTVGDTLQASYLKYHNEEIRGKINLKGGEWTTITASIPQVKGSLAATNYFGIAFASYDSLGESVYLDDISITQVINSQYIKFETNGGGAVADQRGYKGEPIVSLPSTTKTGFIFDGWYYDAQLKNEALESDIYPADKDEITLYAKWVAAPTTATDFTAGSFDAEIYDDGVTPYGNVLADLDKTPYGENYTHMSKYTAWVKYAGIFGNGTSENDGALLLTNEPFSMNDEQIGRPAVALRNEDGSLFTVVKGEKYTIEYDYISAGLDGLEYINVIISEQNVYNGFGTSTPQRLSYVSVQATDSEYQTFKQSFIAERTGYVYFTLSGRDDNKAVNVHANAKVYVDNVSVKRDSTVGSVTFKYGNSSKTVYGQKGEAAFFNRINDSGNVTVEGLYTDAAYTQKFDGKFTDGNITVYVKYKTDNKYDVASDFSKPITLDFEDTEFLKLFYITSNRRTDWTRETTNEWIYVTGDEKNALSGSNYMRLNGFNHYWNQAKFALYDKNNPDGVMLLEKGSKYRVTVMVRGEDLYESPTDLNVILEDPKTQYLLTNDASSYKDTAIYNLSTASKTALKYVEGADDGTYMTYTADIEVSDAWTFLPMLAIAKNANALQTLFFDNITVEKLRDVTVKFDSNGGTDVVDATVQIHDPVYDPGTPFKEGYEFAGWFLDKAFSGTSWDFDKNTVEDDITLYAKWIIPAVDDGDDEIDTDTDTDTPEVEEDITIDNGTAPELLDADAVTPIEDDVDTDTDDSSGFPTVLLIILIAAGSLLLLAAAAVVIIIIIARKKKTN